MGNEQFEQGPSPSLARELWEFLKANKLWFLLPIVVVAVALAGLALLASTGAAPAIYTLF